MMVAASLVLAAGGGDPSALWQILGPIIVAGLALPPAIYTARTTLRAANANNATAATKNEQDRDATLDARIDAVNARLWERNDALETRVRALTAERDALAEQCARLRLVLIGLGLDPDALNHPPALPPPAAAGGPSTQ